MKSLLKILSGELKASSEEVRKIMDDLTRRRDMESGSLENLNRELIQARQAVLAGVDTKKTISGIKALRLDGAEIIAAIDASLRDLAPKLKEAELTEAEKELAELVAAKVDLEAERTAMWESAARSLARYAMDSWAIRGGDPEKIIFSVIPDLPREVWPVFSEEIACLKAEIPEGFLPLFQRLQQIERRKDELSRKVAKQ